MRVIMVLLLEVVSVLVSGIYLISDKLLVKIKKHFIKKPQKRTSPENMTSRPTTLLIQRELECFAEFVDLAVSWDADFRQLDRERISTTIFQAFMGDYLFSHARLGCHVEQRGTTPPGMRTFALTKRHCPEMRWFKHRVGGDSLLLFPKHAEICVFSRPGLAVQSISIPEHEFETRLESNGLGHLVKDHEMVFQANSDLVGTLRNLMTAVPDVLNAGLSSSIHTDEFKEQVLTALFAIIEANANESVPIRAKNVRLLRRATDFIHDHAREPLRVTDLLIETGVSERSLQYLFKRETGMTPKTYLTGKRLFGANRALLHARYGRDSVSDIANQWGFWHMGQFASDYRAMFGELPSNTLRRQ